MRFTWGRGQQVRRHVEEKRGCRPRCRSNGRTALSSRYDAPVFVILVHSMLDYDAFEQNLLIVANAMTDVEGVVDEVVV